MALVAESSRGDNNLPICSLLQQHGASLDHQRGEALDTATRLGAAAFVRTMLLEGPGSGKPSETSLSRAFASSQSIDRRLRAIVMEIILQAGFRISRTEDQMDGALLKLVQERSADIPNIKVLLQYGASAHYSNHQALISAAAKLNIALLRSLIEYVQNSSATSIVFEERLVVVSFWKSQSGLDIMELLLQNGAKGEPVNKALIFAVSDCDTETLAERFINLLLQWNTDVNYQGGRALQLAARKGNFQILSKILGRHITAESVLMAFPFLFSSGVDESGLLSLTQLFVVHLGDSYHHPFTHPDIPDPVSIRYYPKSHKALESVLNAGFLVDQKMYHELGNEFGSNHITALFWTLCLPMGAVSESAIEVLIEHGGRSSSLV